MYGARHLNESTYFETLTENVPKCTWALIKHCLWVRVAAVYIAGCIVLRFQQKQVRVNQENTIFGTETRIYSCGFIVCVRGAHSKGLFLFVRFCMNFISHNYSHTDTYTPHTRWRIFAYVKCYPVDSGCREIPAHTYNYIEAVQLVHLKCILSFWRLLRICCRATFIVLSCNRRVRRRIKVFTYVNHHHNSCRQYLRSQYRYKPSLGA